jgi:hypothetical protein
MLLTNPKIPFGLIYCFEKVCMGEASCPLWRRWLKSLSLDLISFHAENITMCPLMITITPYTAIDTSMWTRNQRKTMLLIGRPKKESDLNPLKEETLLGHRLLLMWWQQKLNQVKWNTEWSLHPPKYTTRKETDLGIVGVILSGMTWEIKNAAVRFQYSSGNMVILPRCTVFMP